MRVNCPVALEKCWALARGRPMSLALLGYAKARLGERSRALDVLGELEAASKQSPTPVLAFALVYTRGPREGEGLRVPRKGLH
jgi:hypothetical protein